MATFTNTTAFVQIVYDYSEGYAKAKECGPNVTISYVSSEEYVGANYEFLQSWTVRNTVTINGTTTLTSVSNAVQIFTGTATQIVQLPVANALGVGKSVFYYIKNCSTQSITIQVAGSDIIEEGSPTVTVGPNESIRISSDGVSKWVIL